MSSRRDVLLDLWRWTGAAAAGGAALLLYRILRGAGLRPGEVVLDGGAVAQASGAGGGVVGDFYVTGAAESPIALSLACTHLGCRVAPAAGGGFQCPCHQSRYDREGNAVQGPARRPLTRVSLERRGASWIARLS